MDRLGRLLTAPQHPDHQVFRAAHVVGVVNDALREITGLSARDATATSLQRDAVIIRTAHGAVAGIIRRDSAAVVEVVNKKLKLAGSPQRVRRLITRDG